MQVIPLGPHATCQWLVDLPQLWGSLEVFMVMLQWMYQAVTGQFALGFYTGFTVCLIVWIIFCAVWIGRKPEYEEDDDYHYLEEK